MKETDDLHPDGRPYTKEEFKQKIKSRYKTTKQTSIINWFYDE